jgi:DNA-binding CsgD family transcriptional regulator
VLWVIDLLELVAITYSDLGSPSKRPGCWGRPRTKGTSSDTCGTFRLARNYYCPCWRTWKRRLATTLSGAPSQKASALSLEEAVSYARRSRGQHNRSRSGWESLTPSEHRVVSLVGQHLTNAQIAERLFISVPTVKSHLNRAFAKLGAKNRGQLAAAAHRNEAPRAP